MCRITMPPFLDWNAQQVWAFHNLPLYWQNLNSVPFSVTDVTSKATSDYNCIAYAAKDETIPWWPYDKTMAIAPNCHWPIEPVWPPDVNNFIQAFEHEHFERCKNGKHQYGYEKVAIYVDANNEPKHMARELGDGVWYSKLGQCQDIRHHYLLGVEDYCDYGKAKYFLRKRISGVTRWQIKKRLTKILSVLGF